MVSRVRLISVVSVLLFALTQGVAVAKGPVDVIEFSGPRFDHPVAVLQGDALLDFSPWGQAFLGERLDEEPASLAEPLTVTMYLDDTAGGSKAIYRFEYYPRPNGGLIYLPGPADPDYDLNKLTIMNGNGLWYKASEDWNAFYEVLMRIHPPSTGSGGLR